MPAVTVDPLFIKDVLFSVALDSYEKAISSVAFMPSSSVQTFTALSPGAVYTDAAPATWTCELTYIQDWETPGSLSNYLLEHEGEAVAAVFEPKSGGTSFAATLIITPGQIGGAVGSPTTATVTLGVVGAPVPTPAP